MKFIILLMLAFAMAFSASAQTSKSKPTIKVIFQNKGLLPKKYVFITYQPSTPGNGTNTKVVAPKSRTTFYLEAGTKVYLANKEQIDFVMSGANLSERKDEPFCVVADAPATQKFVLK